jgi:transcriptional regulator with XRE-family HTH domain
MLSSIHHSRYETLRRRLLALREGAGLTQTQLAERLGVGQSAVSKVERGDQYVDVLAFADWCRVCGADPSATLAEIDGAT